MSLYKNIHGFDVDATICGWRLSPSLGLALYITRAHDRDKQNFVLILAALALQQALFKHMQYYR